MYTRADTVEMGENVLTTMCNQSSNLRIVIATSAFGMGIDCPDIHEGIHWGPPCNVETYAQESGRASKNNLQSAACMLCGDPGRYVETEVKEYAMNNEICHSLSPFLNLKFIFESYHRIVNVHIK